MSVFHAAFNLAATTPVFNIAGIDNLLTSIAGALITAVGAIAIGRGVGQNAHRHVMSMSAVVLAGMAVLGVGLTGNTTHIATGLSSLIFH